MMIVARKPVTKNKHMDFYPSSEIEIGSYRFSGVNEVKINRNMNSLTDTATIKLPGRCVLQKGKADSNGNIQLLPTEPLDSATGKLFEVGDKVRITLGRNGELHEEFAGFVKNVGRGTPTEVSCEGYGRQLRDNVSVNGTLAKTTAKEMLEIAVGKKDIKGNDLKEPLTDIEIICTVDVTMTNVEFKSINGIQVCDLIKSMTDNNVTVFFVKPDVLWCGMPHTAFSNGTDPINIGSVGYRPGWNAIRDGALKHKPADAPVEVKYSGKYAGTEAASGKGKTREAAKKTKKTLNNIPDSATMDMLATEKELRLNHAGYEGKINAFLQPFCQPGYKATIINTLYPELDGDYMVQGVEVTFGMGGARRMVTPGALIKLKDN